MDEIRLSGQMTFDPEDYEAVVGFCEALARDCRDHDGVIEYSFWANGERDAIHVREHYESAEALLDHLGRLDLEAIKGLLEVARPEPVTCVAADTPATRKAVETLAALGVVVNPYAPVTRR
jgi:quinol monooxygenase YgiN